MAENSIATKVWVVGRLGPDRQSHDNLAIQHDTGVEGGRKGVFFFRENDKYPK